MRDPPRLHLISILYMISLPHSSFDNIEMLIKAVKGQVRNSSEIITLKVSSSYLNKLVCQICGEKLRFVAYKIKRKRIVEGIVVMIKVPQFACNNDKCSCGIKSKEGVSRYHLVIPDLFEPNSVFLRQVIEHSVSILDNKVSKAFKDEIRLVHGSFSYLKDFVEAYRHLILRWKKRLNDIKCIKASFSSSCAFTQAFQTISIKFINKFTLHIFDITQNGLYKRFCTL